MREETMPMKGTPAITHQAKPALRARARSRLSREQVPSWVVVDVGGLRDCAMR
jgi:hypothetical protein